MAGRSFAAREGWRRIVGGPSAPGLPHRPGSGGGGVDPLTALLLPPLPDLSSLPADYFAEGGLTLDGLGAILLQQNILLAGILDALLRQVPQGVTTGNTVTVTQVQQPPVTEIVFPAPLFGLSLLNNGPNILQYRIPNRSGADFIDLIPTAIRDVNVPNGLIETMGLRVVAAGGTAQLVYLGLY